MKHLDVSGVWICFPAMPHTIDFPNWNIMTVLFCMAMRMNLKNTNF